MELQILRMISSSCFLFIVLSSCNNKNENRTKELENENIELREQIGNILKNETYKENLLTYIENELGKIDSGLVFLDDNPEFRYYDKQANTISEHIKNLKNKITEEEDRLKMSKNQNESLQKESQSLRMLLVQYMKIIEVKEKQISDMKLKLRDQVNMIELQREQLKKNQELIGFKNKELINRQSEILLLEHIIIKTEAETYERLSGELNKISSQLPIIKGWFTKKEKENIEDLRQRLQAESQSYKTKANNLWKKYNE